MFRRIKVWFAMRKFLREMKQAGLPKNFAKLLLEFCQEERQKGTSRKEIVDKLEILLRQEGN